MDVDIDVCCVCGGLHLAADCVRARRYVRECLTAKVSPPPPEPERPPERRLDHDLICEVLRTAMLELDELDRHGRLRWHSVPTEFQFEG